ncbi:MAG: VapC toxin family PIN domain ribonuclease [Variovorax sp.]
MIDTSSWINHLKVPDAAVIDILATGRALTHPMVIGELALGTPSDRKRTLESIALLERTIAASMTEVLEFVEREKLYGLGCGLIDVTLLISTLFTPGSTLLTSDRKLAVLAERFNVLHKIALH